MPDLGPWQELPLAGIVVAGEGQRVETGGWRTGLKPVADFSKCVNCLLCWLYCPDSACTVDAQAVFTGIDESMCKGCELCAAVCPTGAIEMVAE
jgi:2-oxoacid:acceptor oxidoreductase delta subunit (pyruvate/2-ketoisovalerate family)